jgi:hypothetical protein
MDSLSVRRDRQLDRGVVIRGDVVQFERLAPDDSVVDGRVGGELRKLARGAVHAALYPDRQGLGQDGEAREILRLICDVARAQDTLVERVLVVLKEAWREQPEARRRRHFDAEDTLARVITLCIEEYYAPSRSS